jgi:hypothetical protein
MAKKKNKRLTPKSIKKSRSIRNVRNLFNKLLDAIEDRKLYFCETKGFYCTEAENLRDVRHHIQRAHELIK